MFPSSVESCSLSSDVGRRGKNNYGGFAWCGEAFALVRIACVRVGNVFAWCWEALALVRFAWGSVRLGRERYPNRDLTFLSLVNIQKHRSKG